MGKEGIRTTKTIIEITLTAKRRVAVRNEVARDREVYLALGLFHLEEKRRRSDTHHRGRSRSRSPPPPLPPPRGGGRERETTTIRKRVVEVARILDLVRRLLLKKAEVVFDRRLEIKIHTYAIYSYKVSHLQFLSNFFMHDEFFKNIHHVERQQPQSWNVVPRRRSDWWWWWW